MAVNDPGVQHRTIDPTTDWRPDSAKLADDARAYQQLHQQYTQPLSSAIGIPQVQLTDAKKVQIQAQLQQLADNPVYADPNPYSRVLNAETNGQPMAEAKKGFLDGLKLPDLTHLDAPKIDLPNPGDVLHNLTSVNTWKQVYEDTIVKFMKTDAIPWVEDQMKGIEAANRVNEQTNINWGETAKEGLLSMGPMGMIHGPAKQSVARDLKPGAGPRAQQDLAQWRKSEQAGADLTRNVADLIGALVAAPAVGTIEVGSFTLGQLGQVGLFGLGVTTLPDMLKSSLEEMRHPTDQNMAHAIVNIGNSWMMLAPPIRGLTGIRTLTQLTSDSFAALKTANTDQQAIHSMLQTSKFENDNIIPLISGHADWLQKLRGNEARPLEQMMDELPQGAENLLSYVESKGLPMEHPVVASLMSANKHMDALYSALKEQAGDDPMILSNPAMLRQLVPQAMQAIDEFKDTHWTPARMSFAHEFGLFASDKRFPFPMEMPVDERKLMDGLDRRHQAILGVVRGFGEYGAVAEPAGTTPVTAGQAGEAALRALAGPLKAGTNEISVEKRNFAKELKITPERMHEITRSLDDPKEFEKLSAQERVMGRMIYASWSMHTNFRLETKEIALAASGYVPRKVVYEKGSLGAAGDPLSSQVYGLVSHNWGNIAKAWVDELAGETGHISVHEAALPQKEWLAQQAARTEKYEGGSPLRAAFDQHGEFIKAQRRALGAAKSHITKAEQRLEKFQQQFTATQSKLIPQAQIRRQELDLLLQPLKGVKGQGAAREPILAEIKAIEKQLAKHERELGALSKSAVEEQTKLDERTAALATKMDSFTESHGAEVAHLIGTLNEDLRSVLNAKPGGKTLLSGWDLIDYADRRFALDMHRASFRRDLLALAHHGVDEISKAYLGTKQEFLGHQLIAGKLEPNELPEVLDGRVFRDPEEAVAAGYRQVLGPVGKPTDMNYTPSVFVRMDKADPMLKEMQSATSIDQINKTWQKLYAPVHYGKRAIFISPAWHAENVAGRAISQLIDEPVLGNAALGKLVHARFSDPAQLAYIKTEAYMHGLVPAQRYQVSHQLARMRDEAHGTSSWPGIFKTISGAMPHPYNDIFEKGFWKAVDDVGIMKYMIEDARMAVKRPDLPGKVRKYAAAETANQISGMVNPAYMTKAWRFFRGIASFAPSYWATMLRSVESSVMTKTPFASRLGHFLAQHGHEGITPVRLRHLDYKHYRETARAQAHWFDTYMATTLVVADMLNQIGSGHHLWENDEGRYTDIQMDNFFHPHETAGGTRHTYVSSIPFFRQGADVLNGIGFGHQWGLAHLWNTKEFQDAGAAQKIGMGINAVMEGGQREASTKIGMVPEAAGLLAGIDLTSLIRDRQVVQAPRIAALTAFIPGGYAVRSWIHDAEMASRGGKPVDTKAETGKIAQSLLSQVTGLPSLYWMGGEPPNKLSDETWLNYNQEKTKLNKEAVSDWSQVTSAKMNLQDWQRRRQRRIDKSIQLDADTFKDSTPAGALSKKHQEVFAGLDDPNLSPEDYATKLDVAETAWQDVLDHASPETNAVWWDNVHKQWTDGDYLYWYTRQMKQALAAQVDGQGGKYIQQVNAKYSKFYANYDPATVEQAKESDPYYNVYHALLKQMAQDSPMGALISAFTSPYGARVMPPGLTPDQEQAYLDSLPSSTPAMRGSTLQGLGQQAHTAADAPDVRGAGGQLSKTPGMRQQIIQLITQAGGEVAADSTDEQLLADLQSVLR